MKIPSSHETVTMNCQDRGGTKVLVQRLLRIQEGISLWGRFLRSRAEQHAQRWIGDEIWEHIVMLFRFMNFMRYVEEPGLS